MEYKRQKGFGFAELIIVLVVLLVLACLGYWLWTIIHKSVWYAVIFWLVVASPLIIWLIRKYWDDIVFEIKWRFGRHNQTAIGEYTQPNNNEKWENVTFRSSKQNNPQEDSIVSHIKQFKPRWIEQNGKRKLEGGENGNNANLAQFLRDKAIYKVDTEVTLKNGSRADILINENVILECKPHLLSVEKLHSIRGEIKRIKGLANYKTYAVIYGDARGDFYNELSSEIGGNSIVLFGNLI